MKMLFVLTSVLAAVVSITTAHVVLDYPVPRTNNDYLYNLDDADVCNPNSGIDCRAFCGDPYKSSGIQDYAVTSLPVGVPFEVRWRTNVVHVPYRYRIAMNPLPGYDGNFDRNILTTVSNTDARLPEDDDNDIAAAAFGLALNDNFARPGRFATNITIPESMLETCGGDQPCVLQLYDLYYFVSCANIRLVPATAAADEESTSAGGGGEENERENEAAQTTTTTTHTGSEQPPSASSLSTSGSTTERATTTMLLPLLGGLLLWGTK